MKLFVCAFALALAFVPMKEASAGNPPGFVRGKLICALNVNRFRARYGLRTTGSASAAAFQSLRRVSAPKFGDVVLNRRKGGYHAQIFVRKVGGVAYCYNPSSRKQQWIYQACNRSHSKQAKSYWR